MDADRELILAVVGTTSSGKSTLLNLLAGRWLLPIDTQESPRVVVELRHHPARAVTFHDQSLAPHDEAARERLLHLAEEGLRSGPRRGPVLLNLATHLRLAPAPAGIVAQLGRLWGWLFPSEPVTPRLPTTRVCLRDLPGFLDEDDHAAWQIIGPNLAGAFVLVVLDARATNFRKEDALLRAVTAEIARTDGDWDRVAFLINCVDAYPTDEAGRASLRNREAQLRYRIKQVLRRAGWRDQEEAPPLSRIAAFPAFVGEALVNPNGRESPESRGQLLRWAVAYSARLPGRWPLAPAEWRTRHIEAYHRDAAKVYHWNDFRATLCERVTSWWAR